MSLLFRRKMERFFLEELSAAIGWTSCERVMGIESILLTIDIDKRKRYLRQMKAHIVNGTHAGIEINLASPSQYSERLAEKEGQVMFD